MSLSKELYKAYLDDLDTDSFEEYLIIKIDKLTAKIEGLTAEIQRLDNKIQEAIEISAPDIPPHSYEEKVEAMYKALSDKESETDNDNS